MIERNTEMENNTSKKKLNAVDVVIILLLALCLVGVVLRFVVVQTTPDPDTDPDIEYQKYYVSYISRDHRYSIASYLEEGTEFRFFETNNEFGVTTGNVSVSNAEKWYFNDKGEYVKVQNMAEDERAAKFDLRGTFIVEGKYSEEGVFIIKDSEKVNIALNKPFLLRSHEMIISVHVTDIVPVE